MFIAMEQTGRDAIGSTVDDLAGDPLLVAARGWSRIRGVRDTLNCVHFRKHL